MSWLDVIIISLVEGMTEFLPISSTGHMIVVAHLLGIDQDAVVQGFEIVIQIGAIAAVVWYYRHLLTQGREVWIKIMLAFIPVGAVGFLLASTVKSLFHPEIVAWAFIIGGMVLIFVDRVWGTQKAEEGTDLMSLSYKQSVAVGVAQIFALIPGTSRSGATIVGGLLAGLSRKSATEFSFLIAIPVMVATTTFDLVSLRDVLHGEVVWQFVCGTLIAFAVAYGSIAAFLSFVSRFRFVGFGYYRIILGIVILMWFSV